MGLRRQPYVISDFICTECGGEFSLPRRKGCKRGKGHIKDIWCPNCKKITKFEEKGGR